MIRLDRIRLTGLPFLLNLAININFINIKNEEFWNTVTHFAGVLLTIIGIPFLFYFNNEITIHSKLSLILFTGVNDLERGISCIDSSDDADDVRLLECVLEWVAIIYVYVCTV